MSDGSRYNLEKKTSRARPRRRRLFNWSLIFLVPCWLRVLANATSGRRSLKYFLCIKFPLRSPDQSMRSTLLGSFKFFTMRCIRKGSDALSIACVKWMKYFRKTNHKWIIKGNGSSRIRFRLSWEYLKIKFNQSHYASYQI